MTIFFSALLSFFLFFSISTPQASAEPMMESLQEQIVALRETVESLKVMMASQKETIELQNARLSSLEGKSSSSQPRIGTGVLSAPSGAPGVAGLSQGLNPEIGVNGTVQAQLTENSADGDGRDTIALRELELNFAQYVDPYSRLDAILSFNDSLDEQNASIEEAYYSHWSLPLNFRGQVGKFRSKIGKVNLQHLHQLETSNYPLVIRDFFGDEGLSSSGLRLVNDIPNPWDLPLELSGEVLRGNNGPSFSGLSRRPIFSTHLKSFFEMSKEQNLELGTTAMFGDENPPLVTGLDDAGNATTRIDPQGQDRYGVHVLGFDATYFLYMSNKRTLKFQNELYFQDRSSLVTVNQNPWGFYNLLDYRFSRRFSAGVRFDYLEPRAIRGMHEGTYEISPYLTLWQSEFANFRLQYSHVEQADAEAESDDAVFLQANFLIGVHKHPVQ